MQGVFRHKISQCKNERPAQIHKLLLFMLTLWIGKKWRVGVVNSPKEGLMFTTNKETVGQLWWKEKETWLHNSNCLPRNFTWRMKERTLKVFTRLSHEASSPAPEFYFLPPFVILSLGFSRNTIIVAKHLALSLIWFHHVALSSSVHIQTSRFT